MGIIKFQITGTTIADLEVVAISEPSSNMRGCCTDGTHVFSIHADTIEKFLCADMSLVDTMIMFNGSDVLHNPIGITVYADWLYVSDRISNEVNRIVRFLKTDLSYVDEIPLASYPAHGLDNNGLHLYVAQNANLV